MPKSRTVYAVLAETAAVQGDAAALHQPLPGKGDRKYLTYSWNEYARAVREIACGLRKLGVKKGAIAAIDSETRLEFYIADLGVLAAGCVSAALYISYPVPERARSLKACGPAAVFVENAKGLAGLQAAVGGDLGVPWIVLTGTAQGALSLDELREFGRKAIATEPGFFDRILDEYDADDSAILYLTSGATGEPKMGLTTHRAIVSNLDMGPAVLPVGPRDCTIAFLPSAHIAQRIVVELFPARNGMPVWFSESLARLPGELKSIRPTFLLAPPRVWERIYSSICTEIKKRPAASRSLFHGALGLGLRASRMRHEGKRPPAWLTSALKLADKVVFSKVRERLGGRIAIAVSGAAPLGKDLAHFYEAIGMPLIEGYGLTEGGITAFNPLDRPKPGSIGKLLPGVEMRLAEDGELFLKCPCLFSGYYNDPDATALVLRDGWLATGDIAELDSDGYLYITGRKKELIVSSNGKKIYPSRIEGLFKTEPLINHVVLVGDRMPYLTALFTLNPAAAESLNGKENAQDTVQKAVARANRDLAPFEQIRRFRILDRDFSIEDGEMTPTMKVRRKQVLVNFKSVVDELYLGKEDFS